MNANTPTKSRKQAAQEIHELYNTLEVRPVTFKTIYNRVYRLANGCWHLIGYAHDYTA